MPAIKWFAGMARSYGCPAKSLPAPIQFAARPE